nr:hypothetical protein [uncultured Merdimonas sp.]
MLDRDYGSKSWDAACAGNLVDNKKIIYNFEYMLEQCYNSLKLEGKEARHYVPAFSFAEIKEALGISDAGWIFAAFLAVRHGKYKSGSDDKK